MAVVILLMIILRKFESSCVHNYLKPLTKLRLLLTIVRVVFHARGRQVFLAKPPSRKGLIISTVINYRVFYKYLIMCML